MTKPGGQFALASLHSSHGTYAHVLKYELHK